MSRPRPLSLTLHRALASLDGDATTLQTRTLIDPKTGRRTDIRIEVGLWRHLDELAGESGTTWNTLCWRVLRDSPDTEPDHLIRGFLDRVTVAVRDIGRPLGGFAPGPRPGRRPGPAKG
jgi:hypothetical protein